MAKYRISEDAKADLGRIYRRGIRDYGEALADQYYDAFLIDSMSWRNNLICTKLLMKSGKVTGEACAVWTVSTTGLKAIP